MQPKSLETKKKETSKNYYSSSNFWNKSTQNSNKNLKMKTLSLQQALMEGK